MGKVFWGERTAGALGVGFIHFCLPSCYGGTGSLSGQMETAEENHYSYPKVFHGDAIFFTNYVTKIILVKD
jgi:hypothetical protein